MRIGKTYYQAPSAVKIIKPSNQISYQKGKSFYYSYILSKKWKRKKKQLIKNWECKVCGCRNKRWLNVHHLHYHNLGNEKENDLVVLCGRCHELWHSEKKLSGNNPSYKELKNILKAEFFEKQLDNDFDRAMEND